MKNRKSALCVLMFLLGIKCMYGQDIYGFTTIDFDNASDTVIAYCETDIDYSLQGEYEAMVHCSIINDNTGSEVTTRYNEDPGGYNGYVDVELEVTGTPGTPYTASGVHSGVALLVDQTEPTTHIGTRTTLRISKVSALMIRLTMISLGPVQKYPIEFRR